MFNSSLINFTSAVQPWSPPGSPTSLTATPTYNTQTASVSFTAPSNPGIPALTSYTVTSSPGGFTNTYATSPITVGSLTYGTSYTFTAQSTNSIETGLASAASNAVITYATPGVPTIGTASTSGGPASIIFTPGSTGGGSVTYTATSTPGSLTGTSSTSPVSVSGLVGGVVYTFTVHATNPAGTSSESAASNAITPATFVAVASKQASGTNIGAYSADGGTTWTSTTLPGVALSGAWTSVAGSGSSFAAWNAGGTVAAAAYSTNGGATWTASTVPSTTLQCFCMAGSGSNFAATDRSLVTNSYAYSTDGGATWVLGTLPYTQRWIIGGRGLNMVAVGAGGYTTGAYSINGGQTWSAMALSALPSSYSYVAGNGNNFVISDLNYNTAYSTNGGVAWTGVSVSFIAGPVAGSGNNFAMITGGLTGTNTAAYSTNGGATWTATTLPSTSYWRCISGNGLEFVATGNDNSIGGNNFAAHSIDGGKTWASSTMPASLLWEDIAGP